MTALFFAEAAHGLATEWDSSGVIFFNLLLIAIIVAVNGFFVVAEFALVKIRGSQLDALIDEGDARAVFAKHVIEHLDAYLSATQLGITMASLALGWIGEPYVAHLIEPFFALAGLDKPALVHP